MAGYPVVMLDNRFEPLPSEIRRRKAQAVREAETGVEWLQGCPVLAGRAIHDAVLALTNAPQRVFHEADKRFGPNEDPNGESLTDWMLRQSDRDESRLDAVAAVLYAFLRLSESDSESVAWQGYEAPRYDPDALIEVINDQLLHNRVEWVVEDKRLQERGNSVLHSAVVRPVTALLDSSPNWAVASRAFQTALDRLSESKPAVALTDAATALQEFFRALGANGNSLSDQLNDAERQKVVSATDKKLLKPLVDWVNSDRSTRGNAHHFRDDDASKADAWLMIHVVGAVMVRLSNREPRDIVAAHEKREADAAAAREEQARLEREAAQAVVAVQPADPWLAPGRFGADTPF